MRSDRKLNSAALKDKGGQTLTGEVTIQQMHGLGGNRDTAGGVLEEGKITEEHLEEVLKRLKNGKAPGNDKLTTEMFKNVGYHGRQSLDIYNNVWEEGGIQKDWGLSLIVPIYEKDDNKDCDSYREIMLLNTILKIYEQLLENKLRQIVKPTLLEAQRSKFNLTRHPMGLIPLQGRRGEFKQQDTTVDPFSSDMNINLINIF
ncbi:hypothetical protein Trydic_g9805 [Trypoxylus dichotomus]